MRLDHLLSKETSNNRELFVTSYGQLSGVEVTFTLFNLEGTRVDGGIAQLGEHLLCKQGVIGSSPIISTKKWTETGP